MDCNKTINFMEECKRMCDAHERCKHCPLDYCCSGNTLWAKSTKQAIEIVQKWSDEHPLKTYAQDFFEKFPNAPRNSDGLPSICPIEVYGDSVDKCCDRCIDCWNKPMNVEETEGALKERENNG